MINVTSSKQEIELADAVLEASERVIEKFGFLLKHQRSVFLSTIVTDLRVSYPTVDFGEPLRTSYMSPDGGVLSLVAADGSEAYPILITEVKNQGTNDLRALEGLKKQSMGNAIERLGKNVIGFRTMMLDEGIMPFVCFGYGYDFQDGSSILDRVRTIAMFGELNKVHVVNQGEDGRFNRGSFYFRQVPWTKQEMVDVMADVATRSVHYYIAKHGENAFARVRAS